MQVTRRDEEHIVKTELTIDITGRREATKDNQTPGGKMPIRDMDIVGLSAVKATNRATWDKITNNHTGDPHEGGQLEKKKTTMEYVC